MIVGGFDTLREYLDWMNEEEDPEVQAMLDRPNLTEEALEAMREEFGMDEDDDEYEDDGLEDEEVEFMPL